MKSNQEELQKELEKTLSIIDNLPKAEPKPFFFGRLKHRMNATKDNHIIFEWALNLRVSAVIVVLLLVINCFIAFNYEGQATSPIDDYGAILSDYSLESIGLYEINE